MNTIKTPRELPEDIEEWSDEIEELLSEWAEVSMCYSYLHNYSTRKYRKKYHHLQIPIIILSTLTGTANFATDSYVPEHLQHGLRQKTLHRILRLIEGSTRDLATH